MAHNSKRRLSFSANLVHRLAALCLLAVCLIVLTANSAHADDPPECPSDAPGTYPNGCVCENHAKWSTATQCDQCADSTADTDHEDNNCTNAIRTCPKDIAPGTYPNCVCSNGADYGIQSGNCNFCSDGEKITDHTNGCSSPVKSCSNDNAVDNPKWPNCACPNHAYYNSSTSTDCKTCSDGTSAANHTDGDCNKPLNSSTCTNNAMNAPTCTLCSDNSDPANHMNHNCANPLLACDSLVSTGTYPGCVCNNHALWYGGSGNCEKCSNGDNASDHVGEDCNNPLGSSSSSSSSSSSGSSSGGVCAGQPTSCTCQGGAPVEQDCQGHNLGACGPNEANPCTNNSSGSSSSSGSSPGGTSVACAGATCTCQSGSSTPYSCTCSDPHDFSTCTPICDPACTGQDSCDTSQLPPRCKGPAGCFPGQTTVSAGCMSCTGQTCTSSGDPSTDGVGENNCRDYTCTNPSDFSTCTQGGNTGDDDDDDGGGGGGSPTGGCGSASGSDGDGCNLRSQRRSYLFESKRSNHHNNHYIPFSTSRSAELGRVVSCPPSLSSRAG